jgi:hypothetical protein
MKKYTELFLLIGHLNLNVKDGKTKGQKKLQKIAEKVKPILEKYQELSEDLRLDNASVDKDGNLLINEKGGYSFTKEAIKKLNQQSRDLNESSFDFDVIDVVNPEGLEEFTFLDGWVKGVKFNKIEKEDDNIDL